MSNIAVVYWSGTGCTAAMAEKVAEGAKNVGAFTEIFNVSDFDAKSVDKYDAIAFGCPAMGAEQLEDCEFEPVFNECNIKNKRIGLFGSYGWGDGEWMRDWEKICRDRGALLIGDGVICCGTPDDEADAACKALGAALV